MVAADAGQRKKRSHARGLMRNAGRRQIHRPRQAGVTIPPYEYLIEQCDVPEVRRGALNEYRQFRHKCLEYLRGDANFLSTNFFNDTVFGLIG